MPNLRRRDAGGRLAHGGARTPRHGARRGCRARARLHRARRRAAAATRPPRRCASRWRSTPAARRCARSCSRSRSASPPPSGATTRPSRRSWPSCSARRTAGATRCAACCGRTPRSSSRRSTARRSSTCSCRAPTTSRWRRRSTWPALRDGEMPLELLFSGTVFYAGAGGRAAGHPDLVERRGRAPAARAGLARDDGPVLPRQRLAAPRPRDVRPPRRLQGGRGRAAELGGGPRRAAPPQEAR